MTADVKGPIGPQRNDADVARVLGGFLCLLALPVLAGAFAATLPVDRWLNVAAGVALLAIGAGFLLRGRRS